VQPRAPSDGKNHKKTVWNTPPKNPPWVFWKCAHGDLERVNSKKRKNAGSPLTPLMGKKSGGSQKKGFGGKNLRRKYRLNQSASLRKSPAPGGGQLPNLADTEGTIRARGKRLIFFDH